MTHFGVICPPYPGHLNPLLALGRELQARGHRVTVLKIPDLEQKVRSEGVDFYPIGQSTYRPGTIDQMEPAGETVAEGLNLPFVCLSNGQAIHRRFDVPPFFTPWSYHHATWTQWRNGIAYAMLDRGCQPILRAINKYRQRWHLPLCHQIYASRATLAHLSQQPAAFDFPIPALPKHFHYLGPLRNPSPQSVPFPYDRLTGQPLIYASLGSVQNTKYAIFRCIAAACEELDVQLVITHGGGMSAEAARSLPGSPLVVDYAPQVDVLAKARLTITHGGLNTILDSLSHGVPLVTIPITFEQPGNAARVRWTRTGSVIPLNRLNVTRLRTAVQQVLADESYLHQALMMKQAIAQAGGVTRAADVIERALQPNIQVVERESTRVLSGVWHSV